MNKILYCYAIDRIIDSKRNVIGYTLLDVGSDTKELKDASIDSIKSAIINKQAIIINYELTKDNKLVKRKNNYVTDYLKNVANKLCKLTKSKIISITAEYGTYTDRYYGSITIDINDNYEDKICLRDYYDNNIIFEFFHKSEHEEYSDRDIRIYDKDSFLEVLNIIRTVQKEREKEIEYDDKNYELFDIKDRTELTVKTSELNNDSYFHRITKYASWIKYDSEESQFYITINNENMKLTIELDSYLSDDIAIYRCKLAELNVVNIDNGEKHITKILVDSSLIDTVNTETKLVCDNCAFNNYVSKYADIWFDGADVRDAYNTPLFINNLVVNNAEIYIKQECFINNLSITFPEGITLADYVLVRNMKIQTFKEFKLSLMHDTRSNIEIYSPLLELYMVESDIDSDKSTNIFRTSTNFWKQIHSHFIDGFINSVYAEDIDTLDTYVTQLTNEDDDRFNNGGTRTNLTLKVPDMEFRKSSVDILALGINLTNNLKDIPYIELGKPREVKNVKNKITYEIDRLIPGDMLEDFSESAVVLKGGIAVTDNSHIDIMDLIIPSYNKGSGKKLKKGQYTLKHGGFVKTQTLRNVDITIRNSIKSEDKNSQYDVNLVIAQLRELSKINPIKVYWNTQAYDILTSNNVDVEVINKDEVPTELVDAQNIESLVGRNIFDVLSESLDNVKDILGIEELVPVNTGYNIEIPSEIIERFGLDLADYPSSSMKLSTKGILDGIMLLPMSNVPFTKEVFNRIKMDVDYYKPVYQCVHYDDCEGKNIGVRFHQIMLAYKNIDLLDEYILVTNGHNMIYMAYLGNCYLTIGYLTNEHKNVLNNLKKFDYIDFNNNIMKQSETLSTAGDDSDGLINRINTFFNAKVFTIYNPNIELAMTLGFNDEILAFKYKCNTVLYSIYGPTHKKEYRTSILRVDRIDDTQEAYKELIKDINRSFNNSVVMQQMHMNIDYSKVKLLSDNSISIHKTQVSLLKQLADIYKPKASNQEISYSMFLDIISLGCFNKISEKHFTSLTKSTKSRHKGSLRTPDEISIDVYSFHGTANRMLGKHMSEIKEFYEVYDENNIVSYYVSQYEISDIIAYMIIINKEKEKPHISMEEYINSINDCAQYAKMCTDYFDSEFTEKPYYNILYGTMSKRICSELKNILKHNNIDFHNIKYIDNVLNRLMESSNSVRNAKSEVSDMSKEFGMSYDLLTSDYKKFILNFVNQLDAQQCAETLTDSKAIQSRLKAAIEVYKRTCIIEYNLEHMMLIAIWTTKYARSMVIYIDASTGISYLCWTKFEDNSLKALIPIIRIKSFKDTLDLIKELELGDIDSDNKSLINAIKQKVNSAVDIKESSIHSTLVNELKADLYGPEIRPFVSYYDNNMDNELKDMSIYDIKDEI